MQMETTIDRIQTVAGQAPVYVELPLTIEGECIPFVPGIHTLSNGDPGFPDEGGHVEDFEVIDGLETAELTADEYDLLANRLTNHIADHGSDDRDMYDELYDRMVDDRLTA